MPLEQRKYSRFDQLFYAHKISEKVKEIKAGLQTDLKIEFSEQNVFGTYTKVNMQTESLIKRFGLDDRLFTREVNSVSVDAPKFSGVKRTYNQMANTDVQQT